MIGGRRAGWRREITQAGRVGAAGVGTFPTMSGLQLHFLLDGGVIGGRRAGWLAWDDPRPGAWASRAAEPSPTMAGLQLHSTAG